MNSNHNDHTSGPPVSDPPPRPHVIVARKVISSRDAAIEVTELRLSNAARRALNLPEKTCR